MRCPRRRRSRAGFALAASLVGAVAVEAARPREAVAHGGQYRSPLTPPGLPPPTTGMPGTGAPPATPGVGDGPMTGTGFGRRRTATGVLAGNAWATWWDQNVDRFWADVAAGPVTTGDAGDAERIRGRMRDATVVPFLREVVGGKHGRDGDVLSSGLLALGKTTAEPADVARLVAGAKDLNALTLEREGAVIALGLLRRADPAMRFDGRLLDEVRGHLLDVFDDDRNAGRVRCFAAFAIGLLGDQPGRPGDPFAKDLRATTQALWTRLLDETDDGRQVALLVAIALEPPAGVPSTVLEALRALATTGRLDRRERADVVQAHAVLAFARLAGPEASGVLQGFVRGSHHPPAVRRAAILAMGSLASALDPVARTAAVEALAARAAHGDPDVATFALLSIGRLLAAAYVDPDDHTTLASSGPASVLDGLEGGSSIRKPFAALAAGMALRGDAGAQPPADRVALRDRFLAALSAPVDHDGDDPAVRGACALGLGLARDASSLRRLATLLDRGHDPVLRARAATALGLIGVSNPAVLAALRGHLARATPEDLRREAARALGALGDATAVPALVDELRSGAPDHVRARSAVALGAIRAPAAVAPLIDLAADRVSADDARAVAVAALGLVVDPSRPRSLLRLSADANGLALTDALAEVLSLL